MHTDLKLDFRETARPQSTTHSLLLSELKRLRKKLKIIPFPFCELDCTWISICTENQPQECILSMFHFVNQELSTQGSRYDSARYVWD